MTPGLLYRAAIEGITLALLAGFRSMQSSGMNQATDLCLVGGGSRNTLWRQVLADAFQLPVRWGLSTVPGHKGILFTSAWICSYVPMFPS